MLYENAYKRNLFEEFSKKNGILSFPINDDQHEEFKKTYKKAKKNRQKSYEQKMHFDNFNLYLSVYDLRESGLSWGKIKSKLNLNSIQTARNHFNSASELIKNGI